MALSRSFGNARLKPIRGRFFFKWLNGTPTKPYGPYSRKRLKIGQWMSISPNRKLSICASGYHFSKFEHIRRWSGSMLFKVEVKGERYYETSTTYVRAKKGLARHMRILYQVDPKTGRKLR